MDSNGSHLPQVETEPVNKKKKLFLWIILALAVIIPCAVLWLPKLLAPNQAVQNTPPNAPVNDSVTIKLIFAGDLMGHMPWINSGLRNGEYRYDTAYTFIRPYIKQADYAILNLETTLNGPPYTGYPTFGSPDALARDAFEEGFDFMALANNHCVDKGKSGVKRTLHVLDSLKIPHTGLYNDTASFNKQCPAIVTVKGIRIALLNYSYSTNGMPVFKPNYVSIIDSAAILADIKEAQSLKPDLIISVMHWGEEYSRTESERQKRFAQLMAANGVHAILGAHPHVVQPIKTIPAGADSSGTIVPVFYSVGNFISNQRDRYRDGGIFAELTITRVHGKTSITGFGYLPFWVRKNESNRSYVLIPLNNWDTNGARFHLPATDSLLAVQFLEDTRKLMGPDIKMVSFKD